MLTPHGVLVMVGMLLNIQNIVAEAVKKDVKCLEPDTGSELYLSCPKDHLINIIQMQYGYQELPQDSPQCRYMDKIDACATDAIDYSPVLTSCQGVSKCTPLVRVREEKCRQAVNYFQYAYVCIQDNSLDPLSIVDVCGDVMGGSDTVSRRYGYVESLGYPDSYSPDTRCTCHLRTLTNTATIRLTVLDTDLVSVPNSWSHDWVETVVSLDQWGVGRRLEGFRNEVFDTNQTSLYINFRSDSLDEARGFWIKYEGVSDVAGESPEVEISCSSFVPKDDKKAISCFAPANTGELYLSCQSQGVIYVLNAIIGVRLDDAVLDDSCPMVTNFTCADTAITEPSTLLRMCMGQTHCTVPVHSQPISKCGSSPANFVQTSYVCLQNESPRIPHRTIDVCGDATGTAVIQHAQGYIESPDYPDGYGSNLSCTCTLATDTEGAQVVLYLLDQQLDTSECLLQDWLQYGKGSRRWRDGYSLCEARYGEPIFTEHDVIYLNFHSDAKISGRGFWLKYIGRTADRKQVGVKVSCGRYNPKTRTVFHQHPGTTAGDDSKIDKGSGGVFAEDSSGDLVQHSDVGLVAGLTVTVLLMAVVVGTMIVYKCRLKYKSSASASPSSSQHRLTVDGSAPQRHYSAFGNSAPPYNTLQNDSRASSLRGDTKPDKRKSGIRPMAGRADNTYEEPHAVIATTSSPYINPAYDGTLDGPVTGDEYSRTVNL